MSGCLPWIGALQVLLIAAKLLAVLAWPWWVVMIPLEIFVVTLYVLIILWELDEIK